MLMLLRALIVIGTTVMTWLAWLIAPEVLSFANLRFFAAIFAVCWGLAFFFLRKTGELTALSGLSFRERERMMAMIEDIRRRALWIAGVSVICPISVWLIGSALSNVAPWAVPIVIGLLVGLGLSYLIVLFGWLGEVHRFADKVKMREARKDGSEKSLRRISEAKKQSHGPTHAT